MQSTYEKAINFVFEQEGGYTNNPQDPGGPTNWGITLHDAQTYWTPTATANDVKAMPKSVAEEIYQRHYADPIHYNLLPPGVDLTVLDYAVNSGVAHSVKALQKTIGVAQDGEVGPITLQALQAYDPVALINTMWSDRLEYDKSLTHLWPTFGHGWTNRCREGNALALSLQKQYSSDTTTLVDPTNSAFSNPLDSLISKILKLFKGKTT